MKTEVSLDLLKGKIIERMIMGHKQTLLVFSDNTMIALAAQRWIEDDNISITTEQVQFDHTSFEPTDLIDAEVATAEEIAYIEAENERAVALRHKQREWVEFMNMRQRIGTLYHGMHMVREQELREFVFPQKLQVERVGQIWLYKNAAGEIVASDNGIEYWITDTVAA